MILRTLLPALRRPMPVLSSMVGPIASAETGPRGDVENSSEPRALRDPALAIESGTA